MLPTYNSIEEKKAELFVLQEALVSLNSAWLSFEDFNNLHEVLDEKTGLNNNTYLQNVLKDFDEQDYNTYFVNTSWTQYQSFLKKNVTDLARKKNELESDGISQSIQKVLPYYTEKSSLGDESLTDFKFVNYVEHLFHTFNLRSSWDIWVGVLQEDTQFEWEQNWWADLWEVDLWEADLWEEVSPKKKSKQLDRKIYSWKMKFILEWKKRNIINFIYFIENVWKISIQDWAAIIQETETAWSYWEDLRRLFIDSALNNVKDETTIKKEDKNEATFDLESVTGQEKDVELNSASLDENETIPTSKTIGKMDIYNNLVMDIESIKFIDYIDSSESKSGKRYADFVTFLKKTQWVETYSIDITLNFYVRGLPAYKIEEYTDKILSDFNELKKIINQASAYIAGNKNKLKSTRAVSAKNNMEKFNRYLSSIDKEVEALTKNFRRKKQLEEVYSKTAGYQTIFSTMKSQLEIDLKEISPEIYEQHWEFLWIKQ